MINKLTKKILVTQPSLPPLKDFVPLLEDIWDSKWLTNNGKYHKIFEKELASYLDVDYVSLFSNGTLALISALQVLKIQGEVITTPYSFVATSHALWWNGIKPVFVDIDPKTCNLDPKKLEAAITPHTTAILPVHVYGNPCNVNEIEEIADTYGLKVIYDAAHAFGVKLNGKSILNFGDLSILSFHATKTFNTIEGGAIICHDEKTKKRIDFLKNFGFANETTVVAPGINAKMNELIASYGTLQLKLFADSVNSRREITEVYRKEIESIKGLDLLNIPDSIEYNYSYMPVFVDKDKFGVTRDELYFELQKRNVFGRRYFYPLISDFPTYKGLTSSSPANLVNAHKVTEQVICLPIYSELSIDTVYRIIDIIKEIRK